MTIVYLLIAAIVAFLAYVATRPSTFEVKRTTDIAAPPARVFGFLDDFHNWGQWSPWDKMDPDMQRTHSGPAKGKGAQYAWSGNKKVGQGRMEILEATPSSHVKVDLEFIAPFKARNLSLFDLQPSGSGTRINWRMTGNLNFMMKLMHVFMNMDKMVGKDFEKGLASLKEIAEKN
jgi:carbon monoxide dehydrogenase subunit G